jgi:hypothetical protein
MLTKLGQVKSQKGSSTEEGIDTGTVDGEARTHNRHGLFWDDTRSNVHRGVGSGGSLGEVPASFSIRHPCDVAFISVVWVCKEFES